jgi:Mrp family chromosome partitioning ATPase
LIAALRKHYRYAGHGKRGAIKRLALAIGNPAHSPTSHTNSADEAKKENQTKRVILTMGGKGGAGKTALARPIV